MISIRKRCRRYNEPGHAHALTFSYFRRQSFLAKERTRAWMIHAINECRAKHRLPIWDYVLMPEHVHLLLWSTQATYAISRILTNLKQPVSQRALRFVRESAPIFFPSNG
jgi:putative transposase